MTMTIHSKDFRVRPGSTVTLRKWPTSVKPVCTSKKQYRKLLEKHVDALSKRQRLHYASGRYALLLIVQGMDAAGKDGAIRHVMSGVNPEGCEVFSFKQPSAEELKHDFLWRTTRCLPERGRIGIFNRSYYAEVLIVRVHPKTTNRRARSISGGSGVAPSWTSRRISIATARRSSKCSSPVEGGAAQALSRAPRRAGQELDIQPLGYARSVSARDEHPSRRGTSCPLTTRTTRG
jgi:hypothetical protein